MIDIEGLGEVLELKKKNDEDKENKTSNRMGTVVALFENGTAQIQFDGEDEPSLKTYAYLRSYTPLVTDRVFLMGIGDTYIIQGAVDHDIAPYDYSTIKGDFKVEGKLVVNRDLDIGGDTSLDGDLEVTGTIKNKEFDDLGTTLEEVTETANTAKKTADTAKSTADSASSSASTANSTANTANQTANTANQNATNAVNTANSANTKATNAETTAKSAESKASNSQSVANTANTRAGNAESSAKSADTRAANAQKAADTAQTTANNALNKEVFTKLAVTQYIGFFRSNVSGKVTVSNSIGSDVSQVRAALLNLINALKSYGLV